MPQGRFIVENYNCRLLYVNLFENYFPTNFLKLYTEGGWTVKAEKGEQNGFKKIHPQGVIFSSHNPIWIHKIFSKF